MAVTQEPILARLDRLDNLMRYLEEMKGCNSSRSTPSSGSRGNSFMQMDDELEKHDYCRPIEEVMMDIEHKGSLIDRVSQMEERLVKVTSQVKEMMEADKAERESDKSPRSHHHKKGLKQIVKSCVHAAKSKHKSNT